MRILVLLLQSIIIIVVDFVERVREKTYQQSAAEEQKYENQYSYHDTQSDNCIPDTFITAKLLYT